MRVIFPGEPPHGPWCAARTVPMECRACGADIFWFSCEHGSSVLFDALGSPWPKHDCDGYVPRLDLKRPDDRGARRVRTLEQRLLELSTVLTVRDIDRHTTAPAPQTGRRIRTAAALARRRP